jgi:multicomponent Na+:H+ antiporter subunit C
MSIYLFTGAALFVLGLVAVLLRREFAHKLIGINILMSGVFLIFIAGSYTQNPDSIATALVLTGLVVSLGASAFGLMLHRALVKSR